MYFAGIAKIRDYSQVAFSWLSDRGTGKIEKRTRAKKGRTGKKGSSSLPISLAIFYESPLQPYCVVPYYLGAWNMAITSQSNWRHQRSVSTLHRPSRSPVPARLTVCLSSQHPSNIFKSERFRKTLRLNERGPGPDKIISHPSRRPKFVSSLLISSQKVLFRERNGTKQSSSIRLIPL